MQPSSTRTAHPPFRARFANNLAACCARSLLPLLVLLFPWQAGHAEALGRLFFTPAERTRLDLPPKPQAPPAPPPRLDGIITRSAGAPTLFLDGEAQPVDPREVRIDDATARITGPDGRRHRLRVGDPPLDTASP